MCKSRFCRAIGLVLLTSSIPAYSVDLVQAYRDAVRNDPTLAQARATYLASQEATPQARAALLPQLTVSGQIQNQGSSASSAPSGVILSASQVLFNWNAFQTLNQAKYSVQAAAATFASAEQDMMQRLATAYFIVVRAKDILRYTGEQRDATLRQLEALKERYKYGHATITDVDQSQGAYDTARAQYVRAEIDLYTAVENLSKITGRHYERIAPLKANFPLIKPIPQNETVWSNRATRYNLALRAASLSVIAAQKAISALRGNFAPAISATGTYNSTTNESASGISKYTYGVSLSWSAIQGGLTLSQVREAQANYQNALAARRNAYYQAVADAQTNYIGVLAGVGQVQAGRRAVESNYNALKHTEEGFIAGTQTVLDVLQTQNRLFDAERVYATDRVQYVLSIVNLEFAAGTLAPATLTYLNRWLTEKAEPARPGSTSKKEIGIQHLRKKYNRPMKNVRRMPEPTQQTRRRTKQKTMAELQKALIDARNKALADQAHLRHDIQLPAPQRIAPQLTRRPDKMAMMQTHKPTPAEHTHAALKQLLSAKPHTPARICTSKQTLCYATSAELANRTPQPIQKMVLQLPAPKQFSQHNALSSTHISTEAHENQFAQKFLTATHQLPVAPRIALAHTSAPHQNQRQTAQPQRATTHGHAALKQLLSAKPHTPARICTSKQTLCYATSAELANRMPQPIQKMALQLPAPNATLKKNMHHSAARTVQLPHPDSQPPSQFAWHIEMLK